MSANTELPTSTRNITPADINNIQGLVQRYVRQLLDGCGSHECKSSMCDTGRRNVSPDKPVRKWTPRSARAIAIAVASCPNPSRHVCPFLHESRLEQSSSSEGPRDPSSFTQRLSDTRAIRNFCVPGSMLPQAIDSLNDRAHHVLDPAMEVNRIDHSSTSVISNQQAVARVMLNVRYLLSTLPRHPVALHRHALFHVLEGRAAPANVEHIPVDKRWEVWMKILDGHAYEPSLRLLSRITQIYSLRKSLDDTVWKVTTEEARDPKVLATHKSRHFTALLAPQIDALGNDSQVHLYVWLHQIFFCHWDGSALVQPGTSCCGALEMFSRFNTTQALPTISSHLDAIKVVRSWIQWWDAPSTARHLLHFRKLFTLKERIVYLRMMNHLRMQNLVMAAEKTAHLVRRVAPLEYQVEGALEYATEQYLLLSVSRDNVLRDAYNQLWQRRKSELLRPLRVRLGEIDELEIGQDLGGVQIEFFNLVCKYAFAEESQLFTTDPESGAAYYRAMSLQPLYMFELLGTLFGLALHNGITLPVNLTLSFYRQLLNDRSNPNTYALDDEGEVQLADLQDGWPALHRSFLAMLKQQEAPLYVDYAFPVHANGLRLTVMPRVRNGKSVLLIHDVTSDRHQRKAISTKTRHSINGGESDDTVTHAIDGDNHRSRVDGGSADLLFQGKADFINWPGWSFIPSSEEPVPVTNDNKQSYVKEYATWVIKTSVKPQSTAFKKGFSAVYPICLIQFLSAEQLKNTFEGTTKLSIPDLQKATRYQGYDPMSKYIQSFWKIVNSWPEERQKGLLKFVTAAERIPIGGAGSLTFIIERTDFGDPEQLPTSSTCFGTLRLPRYSSPEVLDSKLRMAIEYGGEGFGSA